VSPIVVPKRFEQNSFKVGGVTGSDPKLAGPEGSTIGVRFVKGHLARKVGVPA
jgi:hypothetical protein